MGAFPPQVNTGYRKSNCNQDDASGAWEKRFSTDKERSWAPGKAVRDRSVSPWREGGSRRQAGRGVHWQKGGGLGRPGSGAPPWGQQQRDKDGGLRFGMRLFPSLTPNSVWAGLSFLCPRAPQSGERQGHDEGGLIWASESTPQMDPPLRREGRCGKGLPRETQTRTHRYMQKE